jgi:hypothetical protein
VARIIPLLGLIGAALLITAVIATLFGGIEQGPSRAALAALPVAAWELSLGVWLVVKGFMPSLIITGIATASTPAPLSAHRTRFTGRMATAPMMAQSPATAYSKP